MLIIPRIRCVLFSHSSQRAVAPSDGADGHEIVTEDERAPPPQQTHWDDDGDPAPFSSVGSTAETVFGPGPVQVVVDKSPYDRSRRSPQQSPNGGNAVA